MRHKINKAYWRLRAAGLCTRCGKEPAYGGCRCDDCADKRNAERRALRKARQEAGLCTACSAPAVTAIHCQDCREKHSRATQNQKIKRYLKNHSDDT